MCIRDRLIIVRKGCTFHWCIDCRIYYCLIRRGRKLLRWPSYVAVVLVLTEQQLRWNCSLTLTKNCDIIWKYFHTLVSSRRAPHSPLRSSFCPGELQTFHDLIRPRLGCKRFLFLAVSLNERISILNCFFSAELMLVLTQRLWLVGRV